MLFFVLLLSEQGAIYSTNAYWGLGYTTPTAQPIFPYQAASDQTTNTFNIPYTPNANSNTFFTIIVYGARAGTFTLSVTGPTTPLLTAPVSSSSTASNNPTSNSSSSSLSGGAIAGIVIGSVAGAVLLCIVIFCLCFGGSAMTRKQKKASGDSESPKAANTSYEPHADEHSQASSHTQDVEMQTA